MGSLVGRFLNPHTLGSAAGTPGGAIGPEHCALWLVPSVVWDAGRVLRSVQFAWGPLNESWLDYQLTIARATEVSVF